MKVYQDICRQCGGEELRIYDSLGELVKEKNCPCYNRKQVLIGVLCFVALWFVLEYLPSFVRFLEGL